MSSSFEIVNVTAAADIASPAGTFTVGYPTGSNMGDFQDGVEHKIRVLQADFTFPKDFSIVFAEAQATVTWKGGVTIPQGSAIGVQLDRAGGGDFVDQDRQVLINGTSLCSVVMVDLGSPAAIDVDAVCESQSGAAGALTLDGALVTDGVATLDVPRNVIVDSGGADTATLTITGTDEYGVTMTEDITLNGTTAVAGKKAFKTVTGIVSDATISNGAFVGTGDVLGLPVFLPNGVLVLAELEDGATVTAGTKVAGVAATATSTTGDVRGTVDPNSACDGDKDLSLLIALPDPGYRGTLQA